MAGLTSDGKDMWWCLLHKALLFCYQENYLFFWSEVIHFFYNIRLRNFSKTFMIKNKLFFFSCRAGNAWKLLQSKVYKVAVTWYMVFFLIICRQPLKFTWFQRASLILGSVALSRSVASDVPFTVCSLSFPYLTIMLLGEELCYLKGISNTGSEV